MLRKSCSIVLQLILLVVGTGATAQSVTELLEKGIYEEETVGDLDAAIEIYDKILNDADAERPYVARALFRRAHCLLKSGKEEQALRSFAKLAEEYPDQAELAAQARKFLPEQPAAGLQILPAPWEDGELLKFVIKIPSGELVGDLTYSTWSIDEGGRDLWRMESYLALPKPEISKYSLVDTDAETALPARTLLYHSQLGTLRAEFTEDERRIRMNRPGEEPQPYTQKLNGPTYDNEQAVFLFRRLPLAEGWEADIQLTGRPGVTAMASTKVAAVETVTVPAGTFECFKVEIGTPPGTETQWFSTDERRTLVKVTNPQIVVELTEITRRTGGPARYVDHDAGIFLSAPEGWSIQKSAFRFGEHDFWVLLFSPELKMKAVLIAQKPDSPMTARQFAEMDTDIYRSRRKSYTVRPDSWTEGTVAGAPSASLMADLEAENTAMVEQRVYVAGKSAFYWFVFRAEPDVFESMKGEIEQIVDSLAIEG